MGLLKCYDSGWGKVEYKLVWEILKSLNVSSGCLILNLGGENNFGMARALVRVLYVDKFVYLELKR